MGLYSLVVFKYGHFFCCLHTSPHTFAVHRVTPRLGARASLASAQCATTTRPMSPLEGEGREGRRGEGREREGKGGEE